ncbi:MAG: metallophosphoesterase [Synergistaceae bacterium]|jgi:predicted MPP superfamily phosphohydrolase|nr:metallophosphoesterase [Synergistaceae bacterium]
MLESREARPLGIFFGTVFCVYLAINGYMFVRLYFTLSGFTILRAVSCVTLALFAVSFPAARLLSGRAPQPLINAASFMSALYISPMLYGFLLTLAADTLRLINNVVAITRLPPPYSAKTRLSVVAFVAAASVVITLAGAWNAGNPVILERQVRGGDFSNTADGDFSLRIALLSDIHLGRLTGPGYLEKLVSLVNGASPDIVLILGDTIDSPEFFRDEAKKTEAANLLSSFESTYGTWAVMGNHDYYSGRDDVENFFADTDARLLIDEAETVGGKFVLVGRDDRAGARYGRARESIGDIVFPIMSGGFRYPMIVMDHQPFELEDAADAGALLQVSGHTHRGQLFPINFVVARIYEKSYGLYKKGNTHYYISSGVGVWGVPVRTVGRPEVVILNFGEKAKDN